ncbi:MAG: protein kinase domain-containing protein [Planctomycetota bacterium]|jgi:serine/threonine protein kinase
MADLKAWADSIVGKTIADRYDVSSVLGMGGNGGVFLAGHKLLGDRAFAVKLIIPNPLAGPIEEQEQRLAREAATALAFVHPRAVQVRDFGFDRENGVMYMAMDYVEGTGLSTLLADAASHNAPGETVIELGRALGITRMILDVLETAETANVVHRDLKPSNIILTQGKGEEDIKVLDFGLAKVVDAAGGRDVPDVNGNADPGDSQLLTQPLTSSGAIMGTVQYMAPEQARGEPVDGRADIYSTGVVLYEMLSGKLPQDGANYHHLLFARAAEPAIPIEEARPDLDLTASVRAVLGYALAMKPGDRFQSAADFACAVEEAMTEAGVEPPAATVRSSRRGSSSTLKALRPPAAQPGAGEGASSSGSGWRRHVRRRRALLIGGVAAGVFAIVAGILLAALWPDGRAGLVIEGRECLERGDTEGALAALEKADRIEPLEDEALALLERARAAALLDRAREAAEAGDIAALRALLEEARALGAEGSELSPLFRLVETGRELERAERLAGERAYSRARAVLATLPAGLPGSWAERARRTAESADLELGRAAALLGAGRAPASADDAGALRAAEAALGRFLEGFPHHPSREEARATREVLLARLQAIGTAAEAPVHTGLRIETRPNGLLCRLDDRVIGRTPLETLNDLEPGTHKIEFIDLEGFESVHELDVVRGRVAHYSFDHAAAVEPERSAFAAASDADPRPAAEVARACRRYLSGFPDGTMRAEVMRILRTAELRALEEMETLRGEGAPPRLGVEQATSFLEAFPGSTHAGEVAGWLEQWRSAAREEEAERDSRERLARLLAADGVPADAREEAVREHLDRFAGAGHAARAKTMLKEHLVRQLRLPGPIVLAASAGPGGAALAFADPPGLAVCRLSSGKTEETTIPGTHDVVALAASPDGSEVYAATATGEILRWRPSSEGPPTVVAAEPQPATSLVALGGGRVVVMHEAGRRAAMLTLDDGGEAARAAFARTVKGPRLGVRSADSRLVALADERGTVSLLAIGESEEAELVWRTRVRGAVKALAFSPGGRLLAASAGREGAGTSEVWSVRDGPRKPLARHRRSSGWLALLDEEGLIMVGGVVLGPEAVATPVPLRVGAACVADGPSGYFLAASGRGGGVIADLPALVRRVLRAREER